MEEQTLESGSFQDVSLSQQRLFEASLHSHGLLGRLAVTTYRTEAAEPLHGLKGKPSTETSAGCSSPCCLFRAHSMVLHSTFPKSSGFR